MTNFPDQPPEKSPAEVMADIAFGEAPDLELAIARALQSAAAIVSRAKVQEFFRHFVGKIVASRFPLDAGGLIRAKCENDAAELISQLLNKP